MSKPKVHAYGSPGSHTICGRWWAGPNGVIVTNFHANVTCKSCLSGGASNTPTQVAAKVRNWKIMRLRGMYACATLVHPNDVSFVRGIIDVALKSLGAEPEGVRQAKQLEELSHD